MLTPMAELPARQGDENVTHIRARAVRATFTLSQRVNVARKRTAEIHATLTRPR
jgi:hypothetical protein